MRRHKLAATLETPKDPFSGIPLPLVPIKHTPRLIEGNEAFNWHHAFHPESDPILQESLGGFALRHCRVEFVNQQIHNMNKRKGTRKKDSRSKSILYHHLYKGPQIPSDEYEQFRTIVWACAGYIPQEGIDLWNSKPEVRALKPHERSFLQLQDPEDPYQHLTLKHRFIPVRDFFTDYAIRQDLSHVDELMIEEFLTTPKEDRKKYLGHLLLALAAEVAASPMEEDYLLKRKEGELHPLVPSNTHSLINYKFGTTEHRESIFPKLERKLLGLPEPNNTLQTEVNGVELAA
jgi:hypothetical protein